MSLRFWTIMVIGTLLLTIGMCSLPKQFTRSYIKATRTENGWRIERVSRGWGVGMTMHNGTSIGYSSAYIDDVINEDTKRMDEEDEAASSYDNKE
jgi:hypothetical protein